MNTRYSFLLFIPLCFSSAAFSAENDQPEKQTEKQQKTEQTKAVAGKRGQIKTLKEFIPSEEVSADKPVAFPNDI